MGIRGTVVLGFVSIGLLWGGLGFSQEVPEKPMIMEHGVGQPGTPPEPKIPGPLPEKLLIQPGLSEKVPPILKETGPQLAGPCLGPDGKLLPINMLVDIHLVAKATGPFSIELSWIGHPAHYSISGAGGLVGSAG